MLSQTTTYQAKNKLIDGPTSLFERGGNEHDRALWAMQGVRVGAVVKIVRSEQRANNFGYHKRTYRKPAYTTNFQATNKLIDGPTSLFERGGPSFYNYMSKPTTKRAKNQPHQPRLTDGGELPHAVY